ncbi:MAG TPA: DUF5668 domain-containing protein [Candidatus Polarisedimenticolia bacterium]|nr:DUF5668 domain-containing protein [Candidatus Polarisedimenticolia bacterium]
MVEELRSPRNAARLFAGLVILCLGALALLNNFDVIHVANIWRFWPLVLIAVGMAKMLRPQGTPGRFAGVVFAIVGLWLLLQNIGVWHYSLWNLWPILVVLVGVRLIWGGMGRSPIGPPPDEKSGLSTFSILGGSEHHGSSTDFRGGDVTAILGGSKLDLRQAVIKGEEAILDVFAMWGGIEIIVPRTWGVVVHGTPILGGFEDKSEQPREPGGPRLIVRGTAIMGGVEIKN